MSVRLCLLGLERHSLLIVAGFELLTYRSKCLQGILNVLPGMNGGGNQPQLNKPFRYYRIHNNRTEYTMRFTKVPGQCSCFLKISLQKYGRYHGVGRSYIKTAIPQAALQGTCNGPKLVAEFGTVLQQVKSLHQPQYHRHRQGLGEGLGPHIIPQIGNDRLGRRYKSADARHGLRKRSEVDIYFIDTVLRFMRTGTSRPHGSETVCIIDKHAETVLLLQCCNFFELSLNPGHPENALCDQQNGTAICAG